MCSNVKWENNIENESSVCIYKFKLSENENVNENINIM